jgi:sialic acid synthase SpsE
MKVLLCLIKRMNPQKMNVSKSENMLIHLVHTLLRNQMKIIFSTSFSKVSHFALINSV